MFCPTAPRGSAATSMRCWRKRGQYDYPNPHSRRTRGLRQLGPDQGTGRALLVPGGDSGGAGAALSRNDGLFAPIHIDPRKGRPAGPRLARTAVVPLPHAMLRLTYMRSAPQDTTPPDGIPGMSPNSKEAAPRGWTVRGGARVRGRRDGYRFGAAPRPLGRGSRCRLDKCRLTRRISQCV